jgi:hypothetical protein
MIAAEVPIGYGLLKPRFFRQVLMRASPRHPTNHPKPGRPSAPKAVYKIVGLTSWWRERLDQTLFHPRFVTTVDQLSAMASRRPGDLKAMSSRWTTAIGISILCLFFGLTAALIIRGGRSELTRWDQPDPALLLPPDGWQVLLQPSTINCPPDARGSGCLADPHNPALWNSSLKRTDGDHLERLRAMRGKTFWIGTQLQPELLKRAYERGANVLVLGWIWGSHRVFIDGLELWKGTFDTARTPITLNLPASWMASPRPLGLAIEIVHDADSMFPDMLNRRQEHLATPANAQLYVRGKSFNTETLPAIGLALNLALALIFGSLWIGARQKQEHLFLAAFCAVSAMIQATNFDWVFRTVGFSALNRADTSMTLLETFFGLFLGLAFARAPLFLFQSGIALVLGLAITLPLLADSGSIAFQWAGFIAAYLVPLAYGVGALMCALQATHLAHRAGLGDQNPSRMRRLWLFAAGLAVIMILRLDIAQLVMTEHYFVVDRFFHFAAVLFLAGLVISDSREQERLIRRFRVSKYHQRTPLPKSVLGWMVKVDLKRSTSLAETIGISRYGDLVTKWYDMFCERVVAQGGEVMSEEGDAISVFFDDERGVRDAHWVIHAVRDMVSVHPTVQQTFDLPQPIHLRAAAMRGALCPIWKGSGEACRPAWDGTILVDCARVLELERMAPGDATRTRIVIPLDQVGQASNDQEAAPFAAPDKDGKQRDLIVVAM